jgi:hypothetical protein
MPGVRVNLGLTRASLSCGHRGFTYNIGSKGSRVTVGLPGTGLSYTQPILHQSPVALVSNALPPIRRYSATPFVIIAFVAGLIYLAAHSSGDPQPPAAAVEGNNISEPIASPEVPTVNAAVTVVPLPRPRPKAHSEVVGPPLQLIPQQ